MGAITQNGGTEKPGDVKFHAAYAVPPGWLKANGAAVSRSVYGALFLAIGTTYGAGDGVNTFNLPDLRGEFLRGFDDGLGRDAGRVFGSAQSHQMQDHAHGIDLPVYGSDTDRGTGASIWSIDEIAQRTSYGVSAGASAGAETRPENVAMLPCIKY